MVTRSAGRPSIFSRYFSLTSARPSDRIDSGFDQTMECRERPIPHGGNVAVFHRIEMHVIHMRPEIGFIANQVLPISALPDSLMLTNEGR